MTTENPKPFLKWVGGKKRLMTTLEEYFPKKNYNRYYEPFLGGGSVFFNFKSGASGTATISDLNGTLIDTYISIRDDLDELYKHLKVLEENTILTCGKYVDEFETQICNYVNATYGVAVNSGTAALHSAIFAIDIREGDEVIVPAISFVASANCILYQGGKPVFCDIFENVVHYFLI